MDIKKLKIPDDDLLDVVGGFKEEANLPTRGMNICCPNPRCRASSRDSFDKYTFWDARTNSVEYHCKDCGTSFVCYDKGVILKADWIKLCDKNNYVYPNA